MLDVSVALARLPAETRARLSWAKSPIEGGLTRLRTEPLTDALVAEVADQMWRPLMSFVPALAEVVGSNLDEWRANFVDELRAEEEQLSTFLESDDSRDTLRWILGLLHSFMNMTLSLPREALTHFDEGAVASLVDDPGFKPYVRGLVALMAAAETRRRGGDAERARDLLDLAFLQLHAFRANLRKQGVSLSAFPNETVEQRRHNLLESAERLREALSQEDWRTIDQARVRDLR